MNYVLKRYSKSFSNQDILLVQAYVINKLQVRDIYMVKDRFEGNLFLKNTIARYFIIYTLLNYISYNPEIRYKIGFIATLNLEKLVGVSFKILGSQLEFEEERHNEDIVYFLVNSDRKKCEIYSVNDMSEILSKNISSAIIQYGNLIFSENKLV